MLIDRTILGLFISLVFVHLSLASYSKWNDVHWKEQFNTQCSEVWSDILSCDSVAEPALHYLQFTRCALLQNDVRKARTFLRYYRSNGGDDSVSMCIIEARILVRERQDAAALSLLKKIAPIVNMRSILKMKDFQVLINRYAGAANFAHTYEPSLNVFTFLMASFSLYGLIVSITLLFNKKIHRASAHWLSALLAAFSLIMISFVLYWSSFNFVFPYLNGLWHSLYFVIGPLFYFYLAAIFDKASQLSFKWLHFIPAIFILFITLFAGQTFISENQQMNEKTSQFILSLFFKLIHLSVYFALSYQVTKGDWAVDKKIGFWRKVVLAAFLVFLLANYVYYALTFWSRFNTEWDYFISGIMAIGILGIAVIGMVEPYYLQFKAEAMDNHHISHDQKVAIVHDLVGHSAKETSASNEKYYTSTLTATASMSIKMKLEQWMSEKQIFKDNELRLQTVADLLGVRKHHLSQVINENYGLGFFEFVNQYRIEYARQLLSNPKNTLTVAEIAYQSGFNNKVTFYKVFKQYYKVTPLEFISNKNNERAMLS